MEVVGTTTSRVLPWLIPRAQWLDPPSRLTGSNLLVIPTPQPWTPWPLLGPVSAT